MQPIVTPEEMAAIDRAAPEPVEVLIGRAGSAVMRHAIRMMGGTYGRRVVVVAGKGNNGNDGRDAASRLRARGVRVEVIDAASAEGTRLPAADLVIDAAYGTGFRGDYHAPDPGGAPVLAVDIPSGVNGRTGEAGDGAVRADETVVVRGAQARTRPLAGTRARRPGPCRRHRARRESRATPISSRRPMSRSGSRCVRSSRTSGGPRCGSSPGRQA